MSSPVRLQRPSNLALDPPKSKSVTFKEDTLTSHTPSNTTSPRKLRCDSEFRTKRKRAHSCPFPWDHFNNKKRKPTGAIVLPSKFLLGGNITDPLNLEALDKEDPDKSSEETFGGGCRRGGTVRVIIPPNINDPLNLDACSEDGEEQLADAISRQRRRRKTRKRKRRNSEPGGMMYESVGSGRLCTSLDDSSTPRDSKPIQPNKLTKLPTKKDSTTTAAAETTTVTTLITATVTATTTSLTTTPVLLRGISDPGIIIPSEEASSPVSSTPRHPLPKKMRTKAENKIVSPVVPQPGVERKRHCSHQRHPSLDKPSNLSQSHLLPPKNIHPKNAYFQYGNYNQYYGYRNMGNKADPRLKFLQKEWFAGKEVLDIGCNIGHITLCVGRDFAPQRVIGIDIDRKLINIAKKNIKHYVRASPEVEDEFPSSMRLLYGPLKPPVDKEGQRIFPHNVRFYQSNYVLENDALLETVRPEFDVILCLSVTKWVHLNWGDEGLKRFFKRIFRNLKPGGLLILEPQAWPSYNRKRKLTMEIFEIYKSIRLFPNKFGEFLTSEVGFIFVQKGSAAPHYSKGFDRPLYIYKKPPAGKSPSQDVCSKTTAEEVVKLCDEDQKEAATSDTNTSSLPAISASPSLSSRNSTDDNKAKKVVDSKKASSTPPALSPSLRGTATTTTVANSPLTVGAHKDSSDNLTAFPVEDAIESSADSRTAPNSNAVASGSRDLKAQVIEGTVPESSAASPKTLLSPPLTSPAVNILTVNAHLEEQEKDSSGETKCGEQSSPKSCGANVDSNDER